MAAMMSASMVFTSAPSLSYPALPVSAPNLLSTRPAPAGAKDDQNRRSACDRCRQQKLRCERRPFATLTDSCKRCLKSRARCVTGPSLPMGRPRIRTSPSPHSPVVADYRSAPKRGSISASSEYAPTARPEPLAKSRSSPSMSTSVGHPGTAEVSVSNVNNNMMPPTTIPLLEMGPPAKMMVEPIYTDMQDLYAAPTGVVGASAPSARPEDPVRTLYELGAQALNQCRIVAGHRSVPSWSINTQSIDSIVAGMAHPPDQGLDGAIALHELMETCNGFLRVSQALLFHAPPKSPLSSRHPSVDYAHTNYGANAFQQLRSAGVAGGYSPSSTSPIFDEKDTTFSPASMPSLSSSVASSLSPGLPERLDFPTILALYTTYTTILRIFRTLLTRVNIVILSHSMPWGALDGILPGIYPEGAQAEHHPDWRIKMFLTMCRDSLDQMEKQVTLSTKFYHGGAEPELLRALVETLVKAEASEGARGIVSPKTMVEGIYRALEGSIPV